MKKDNQLTIPNIITSLRIAGTLCLLWIKPFTPSFYFVYTLCGFSDVLDGFVARITKKTTEFGARLDSIADLLFYAVMLLQILPVLWVRLPREIWYIVGVVLVTRLVSYLIVAIKYKRFAAQHTYMNKLTGAAVFSVPYFLTQAGDVVACFAVCVIAGLATVEELLIHVFSREYRPERKSILKLL